MTIAEKFKKYATIEIHPQEIMFSSDENIESVFRIQGYWSDYRTKRHYLNKETNDFYIEGSIQESELLERIVQKLKKANTRTVHDGEDYITVPWGINTILEILIPNYRYNANTVRLNTVKQKIVFWNGLVEVKLEYNDTSYKLNKIYIKNTILDDEYTWLKGQTINQEEVWRLLD